MLEAEMSFISDLEDVMSFVETSLKSVVRSVLTPEVGESGSITEEMGYFAETWERFGGHPTEGVEASVAEAEPRRPLLEILSHLSDANQQWPRITYKDAIQELSTFHSSVPGGAFEFEPRWCSGLQSEHEKWLAGTLVGGPVFVTNYPRSIKPFYMRINDVSSSSIAKSVPGETVACFDLLIPRVGELVGGSLREDRESILRSSLADSGIVLETLGWYMDLRKFGGAPHGGFGMGLERFLCLLTGWENVKDVVPFPRVAGKILL
jgi:asparaginyl-tRNA synthetase